ncbi:MAG: hypothetical protein EU529_15500 [Promethearchaeota archaeon]|nr:MAG: hypothetical protein EU529_15500 [Candidatus Lokiarchaeota archaeon]
MTVQTTDYVTLFAKLTDNEKNPIGNKLISFTILIGWEWRNLGRSYTNEEGLVEFNWLVTTKPGIYVIKAEFFEDDYFVGSRAYAVATIEKEDTKILISTMISDTYGKYDIMATLVEDDHLQKPIPGEDLCVGINGNERIIKTDDYGSIRRSIQINTFDDISIEADYDGSDYFHPSSEEQVKTFDEEWDFFNSYSDDMMIDLFEEYSDLSGANIPEVARYFFNVKEDLREDGDLNYISNISEFLNLIDSEYFVEPWSNLFEIRNYEYFPCPWTNGHKYFKLSYETIFQPLLTHNEPFTPTAGSHVDLGTRFDFSHDFWAIINKIFDFKWSDWTGCSDDDVTNALGLSVFGMYLVYGLGDDDETIDAHGSIPGDDEKYRWDLWRWKDWEDFWNFEWVYELSDTDWKYKYEYLKEIIRAWVTVDDGFTVSIPTEFLGDWSSTKYGLFWDYLGDVLRLGFDTVYEQFLSIIDSELFLLLQIGINVYELLAYILQSTKDAELDYENEKPEDYSGRTLFLIHGFDGRSKDFKKFYDEDANDEAEELDEEYENLLRIDYYDNPNQMGQSFDIYNPIQDIAEGLKNFMIDNPEYIADNVDFLCHSMGGLVVRYMIKHYYDEIISEFNAVGRNIKINYICMIGTPNEGTNYWWVFFYSRQAQQMRPHSNFLDNLNRGDETPDDVDHWYTYRSRWFIFNDDGVVPVDSVPLDGAINRGPYYGVHHNDQLTNKQIRRQVLNDLT